MGFEPTMGLPPYTLSRRAPSASSDIAPPASARRFYHSCARGVNLCSGLRRRFGTRGVQLGVLYGIGGIVGEETYSAVRSTEGRPKLLWRACWPSGLAAVALVLFGLCACAGGAGAPLADGLGVGISTADVTPERIELVAKAGFRWVRIRVPWAEVERQKGSYDLAVYQNVVRELDRRRVRIVLVLGGSNPLYSPPTCPAGDEGRAAFASYCRAVASALKGRDRWWEIWEHPNVGDWGGPSAQSYAKLVTEAAKTIREVDRSSTISSGALSGVDLAFLREACASGLLGAVDVVAVEPTRSSPPETVAPDLQRARQVIESFSRGRRVPLWVAGWGYSTKWPGVDQRVQAVYAVRMALVCLAEGVPLVVWKDLCGRDGDGFGLIDGRTGETRAAYQAFCALAGVTAGGALRRRMEMPAGLYGVVLECRGGQVMVVWAHRGRGLMRCEVRRGEVKVLDVLGQPVEASGGSGYTAVRIEEAPTYVVGRASVTDVELMPAGE